MLQMILLAVAAAVCIAVLTALFRSGHFLRTLLFSAVTGNAALFCVGYLGAFTGVVLSVNLFTMAAATVLGIPGVLAMLLMKLLFAA